ncbi:hypothetical protein DM860_000822 [Cuscuta australis]|uniref:RING-type E3 ubiquitin transferase n=1 Tax=Cuscuta australis TaxID=267555 RepID=A0A328D0D3_9ASTE|nr:hypothetical protein DM860_000822 [Cuscuta australis]
MEHRNIPHSSHTVDYEADNHTRQNYVHPDLCVFYGNNMPTFPQPISHTLAPVSGNTYLRPLPDQRANALFYGMAHYNGTIHHQRPVTNHYNPYMAATSSTNEFPMSVPNGRNIHFADGVRGSFKRKDADGFPMNFQYHHAMVGSSSSVEAFPAPPDSLALTEFGYQSGHLESEAGHNRNNHFIQGSFVSQGFQPFPAHPWLDMPQLNTNQAAPLHYVHASTVGGCVDGNMGAQDYHAAANNGSLASFMRPTHIPQGFSSVHHLPPSMQVMRSPNVNFHQMAPSSHRLITNISQSPSPGVVEAGLTYMGPFPPNGFRIIMPHQRDLMAETNIMRNPTAPNMRVLPEDGVAILEIPEYEVVGGSVDQHREMRMDIDHMSYEELLALGEQIGCVTTGLSEEFVTNRLKTRLFFSRASSLSPAECLDQETDFCVICQHEYKDQENIGIVECGHEYHADCIKKWLVVKNSCPICKSSALSTGKLDL